MFKRDSTNVVGSSLARETDGEVYQRVGPEIGVASTKAFSSQACLCAMLGLALGRMRDLSPTDGPVSYTPMTLPTTPDV